MRGRVDSLLLEARAGGGPDGLRHAASNLISLRAVAGGFITRS